MAARPVDHLVLLIARGLARVSPTCLLIPLWPFYLILMFGFRLTAFVAFLQMVEDIISFVRGEILYAEIEVTTDI